MATLMSELARVRVPCVALRAHEVRVHVKEEYHDYVKQARRWTF